MKNRLFFLAVVFILVLGFVEAKLGPPQPGDPGYTPPASSCLADKTWCLFMSKPCCSGVCGLLGCKAACTPNCGSKVCGSDGCGGSCGPGPCPTGYTCSDGQCKSSCVPQCTGKSCGDDGCGGSCGTCSQGTCQSGKCVVPTECTQNQKQDCGNCGKKTCQPDGKWGACTGEGECVKDSTLSCGKCGTMKCNANCHWSACTGQGPCTPGELKSCGSCKSKTCGQDCKWGACVGEGVCEPGASQLCSKCGNQTCNNNCNWGTCKGQGVCDPGDVKQCGGGQFKNCTGSCQWTACVVVTSCMPNCAGKCGGASDGCSGTCAALCPSGQTCSGGKCVSEGPSITVLSPNGGEVWGIGKTYEIKWTTKNWQSNDVAIALIDSKTQKLFRWILGGTTLNDGVEIWQVPNDPGMVPGDYLIQASYTSGIPASDISDAPVSIVAAEKCKTPGEQCSSDKDCCLAPPEGYCYKASPSATSGKCVKNCKALGALCSGDCCAGLYCGDGKCVQCATCDSLKLKCGLVSTECGTINCGDCSPDKVCTLGQCKDKKSCTTDSQCSSLDTECVLGQCVDNVCYGHTKSSGTPCTNGKCDNLGNCVSSATCYDNDPADNVKAWGQCKDVKGWHFDICPYLNSPNVTQYSCANGMCANSTVYCPNGYHCDFGTCVLGKCGDNLVDSGENCEGTNLNGKSCADISGFSGGTLKCTASDCKFDVSGCASTPSPQCAVDADCFSINKECRKGVCLSHLCVQKPKDDGTACAGGTCQAGECTKSYAKASWKCYGDKDYVIQEGCKTAAAWSQYAETSCSGVCDDGGKCGMGSYDLYANLECIPKICSQVSACASSDGCCPSGCTEATDNDCSVAAPPSVSPSEPIAEGGGSKSKCTNGQTMTCGNCQKSTCYNNQWSACQGSAGECNPKDKPKPCSGTCMYQRCGNDCKWSKQCTAIKECTSGTTMSCGTCGKKTCTNCMWGSCVEPCAYGATTTAGCGKCSRKTCEKNKQGVCQWSSCQYYCKALTSGAAPQTTESGETVNQGQAINVIDGAITKSRNSDTTAACVTAFFLVPAGSDVDVSACSTS